MLEATLEPGRNPVYRHVCANKDSSNDQFLTSGSDESSGTDSSSLE